VEGEYLTSDPTAKVPAIRVPAGVPRPIPEGDLIRAVEQADVRMRAWLLLMALAGLRCVEVAGLRPADLVPGPSGVLLYLPECKGGGTARVPAHPLILRALEQVPIRNEAWWELTAGSLSASVNRYLRSVGVRSTAHSLRHFAGTSWYRASGHDLLATATLLQHVNVNTTQVYARIDDERPTEVVHAVGLAGIPVEPTCPPPGPDGPGGSGLRLVRDQAG
jgi:integrase/recombinase XerC